MVGWRRVVIIAALSTAAAIILDDLGVVDAVDKAVSQWHLPK